MTLGSRIQLLRKQKSLSQEEFANSMGVTRQSVSKWELDQSYPAIDKLIEIANFFHISLNEMLKSKQGFKISNFEELATVDINKVKVALSNVDKKQIIMASLGASPTTNDFLERIFPDIDFPKMREVIGRISIEEVEKAEQEIVKIMNEYEANK